MEPVKERQGAVDFPRGEIGNLANAGEARESVAVGRMENKSGSRCSAYTGDVGVLFLPTFLPRQISRPGNQRKYLQWRDLKKWRREGDSNPRYDF